jgi:hypothetical protein
MVQREMGNGKWETGVIGVLGNRAIYLLAFFFTHWFLLQIFDIAEC